jgi:hypothetical protein
MKNFFPDGCINIVLLCVKIELCVLVVSAFIASAQVVFLLAEEVLRFSGKKKKLPNKGEIDGRR